MPSIRRMTGWLLFAFVIYAIITAPDSAANMVGSAWDVLATGVSNIGNFFDSLINRG